MRGLIALGLTICVASSAVAQTEIIIRRPGEKDQVIRLDTGRTRDAIARTKAELNRVTTVLHERMTELQAKSGELRLSEEPTRMSTLALKNSELAAERAMGPMVRSIAAAARRQPHLGVVVATERRESDKYGAYISAVTPGSPAEKAGIISGDIITRIAGKSLTDKDAKDDSSPGVRLISIISTLVVGKPVDAELRRGTQNKSVKITPDDDGGMIARMAPSVAEISRLAIDRPGAMAFGGELPSRTLAPTGPGFNVFSNSMGNFAFSFGDNGLFSAYELAPLNEKLGSYFGVTEGVLVVNTNMARATQEAMPSMPGDVVTRKTPNGDVTIRKVPGGDSASAGVRAGGAARPSRDSTVMYIDGVQAAPRAGFWRRGVNLNLGLEPGDVIVSVDERKVTSPSQLMRIVGSYEHNDEFKLHIMRQKRAETLTVKLP